MPLPAYLLGVDWATVSSLATGAGTLVLAVATFAAVRSSNRAARVAESALQEQRRPLLGPSRFDDPKQKINFFEGHWVSAEGGHAAVEHTNGVVYLAISLRNIGSGIAVCQGWVVQLGEGLTRDYPTHAELEDFRAQSRDLYVPAGDIGMWQGALRNPDDPVRAAVVSSIEADRPVVIELLYTDHIGRQRKISRFRLLPANGTWVATLTRHWYLDWEGPRPESLVRAANDAIMRDHETARRRAGERAEQSGDRHHEEHAGQGRAGDERPGDAKRDDRRRTSEVP